MGKISVVWLAAFAWGEDYALPVFTTKTVVGYYYIAALGVLE